MGSLLWRQRELPSGRGPRRGEAWELSQPEAAYVLLACTRGLGFMVSREVPSAKSQAHLS